MKKYFCSFWDLIDGTAEELDRKWGREREEMTRSEGPQGGNDGHCSESTVSLGHMGRPFSRLSYQDAPCDYFLFLVNSLIVESPHLSLSVLLTTMTSTLTISWLDFTGACLQDEPVGVVDTAAYVTASPVWKHIKKGILCICLEHLDLGSSQIGVIQ